MRGFTLTELAVVLVIVGLLMASGVYTMSAQVESRYRADTQRRLEEAKDLLVGFALVHARLPCPGIASGDEAGGGTAACASPYGGFLPARAIGFQPADAAGFALDAWGNRIRYAVSATAWGTAPARFTRQHAAAAPWSITQTPADLVICSASPAVATALACDAGTSLTNQNTVVAVVFSSGKNGSTGSVGADEIENTDNDGVFVYHEPRPAGAPGGEYDDMVAWLPASLLYNRLIGAGVLP